MAQSLGRVGRPSKYSWKEWVEQCLNDPTLVIEIEPEDGRAPKFQQQAYNRARYYGVNVRSAIVDNSVLFAFYKEENNDTKVESNDTKVENSKKVESNNQGQESAE